MGKEEIVLVDTSSWVEALRSGGKEPVRERVHKLLIDARAVVCDVVLVRLPLWRAPLVVTCVRPVRTTC